MAQRNVRREWAPNADTRRRCEAWFASMPRAAEARREVLERLAGAVRQGEDQAAWLLEACCRRLPLTTDELARYRRLLAASSANCTAPAAPTGAAM